MEIYLKLNFLLPFTHLKSNLSNFNNLQVFTFHGQHFPDVRQSVTVQGFKSSIISVTTSKQKIKTMSNLTLKIVPTF